MRKRNISTENGYLTSRLFTNLHELEGNCEAFCNRNLHFPVLHPLLDFPSWYQIFVLGQKSRKQSFPVQNIQRWRRYQLFIVSCCHGNFSLAFRHWARAIARNVKISRVPIQLFSDARFSQNLAIFFFHIVYFNENLQFTSQNFCHGGESVAVARNIQQNIQNGLQRFRTACGK